MHAEATSAQPMQDINVGGIYYSGIYYNYIILHLVKAVCRFNQDGVGGGRGGLRQYARPADPPTCRFREHLVTVRGQ